MQAYQREMILQQRRLAREKAMGKIKTAEIQKHQINEFKSKTEETNKIYANRVTPDYFAQFQTTAR